ncbi:MAG: class I SAM-dependent methyltransferase [Acidaminococcales bacterium]|jgi:SAM-dependent methyltransferase|nr:class I SAM-dependent methyltransferase [Acidaminococcales bacterium]
MDLVDYELDFYKSITARVGPSSDEMSARALNFIPRQGENSHILEIGCGAGFQTLFLARNTAAKIVAIDIVYQFVQRLQNKLHELHLSDRAEARVLSMDQISYPDGFFDVIWAENSIYHIGFERGVSEWRRYLRPGGYLAATEIAWLTDRRPREAEEYLLARFASPDTLEGRLSALKKYGYKTIAHFVMPEECWTEHYYKPAQAHVEDFLKKHGHNAMVQRYVQILITDMAMHDKYKEYYGVVFFVAQKDGQENIG